MKEQFVTYEIALALKELGFDENCMACFGLISEEIVIMPNGKFTSNREFGLAAPLWQQVIDWFRVNHNIHISIYRLNNNWAEDVYDILRQCYITTDAIDGITFSTYEEAREKVILKTIELIKNHKL